jgi:hypothetical protein
MSRSIEILKFIYSTNNEIARHYAQLYSSLWCCPSDDLMKVTSQIITNYFNNTLFSYTSAHKHNLEGNCDKHVLNMKLSNFPPFELPMMATPVYGNGMVANILDIYPLCSMPLKFVKATQDFHNRTNQRIFLAFDGQGNISDYEAHNTVIGSQIMHTLPNNTSIQGKDIDMMIAIFADLSILNPKSTLSWQIFVIRECLGLESVPKLQDTDLLMRTATDHPKQQWINWKDIINACKELRMEANKMIW